jgi:integrase
MLLADFFENVYLPRRLRGKSQNSVRLYRLCIRQFGLTLGRAPKVADLTEENVFAHLARRSKVAPATRNKELSELTAMWRLAVQRNLHTGWPDIQPEPEPDQAPIAFLAGEVKAILNSATRQRGEIDRVPAWLWWNGLIRVILDTGERISAARSAEWSWLNGEWLTIPARARKGHTRDRQYRISPATVDVLQSIRLSSPHKREVFPWPYAPTYLWKKYGKVIDDAGLPDSGKHKFHALRKTCGSVAYAAGLDPQDVLDHSDRRTTQRYLDARFQRKEQACDALAEYLANPPAREKPAQTYRDVG